MSLLLKRSRGVIDLISGGKEFQMAGPLDEKALLPNILVFVFGVTRKSLLLDLKDREGWYSTRSSFKYVGAMACLD